MTTVWEHLIKLNLFILIGSWFITLNYMLHYQCTTNTCQTNIFPIAKWKISSVKVDKIFTLTTCNYVNQTSLASDWKAVWWNPLTTLGQMLLRFFNCNVLVWYNKSKSITSFNSILEKSCRQKNSLSGTIISVSHNATTKIYNNEEKKSKEWSCQPSII